MTRYPYEHLKERLERSVPEYRFDSRWEGRPEEWHAAWRQKLIELMGGWAENCDPDVKWEPLEDRESHSVQRLTYQTEPGLRTFAFAAVPYEQPPDEGFPGVLCFHGHGPLGAYPVMNAGDRQELGAEDSLAFFEFEGDRSLPWLLGRQADCKRPAR